MPIPSPLRLKETAIEPFRHFDCRFYHACLATACLGRWESWSCVGCEAFEAAEPAEVSHNRGQD